MTRTCIHEAGHGVAALECGVTVIDLAHFGEDATPQGWCRTDDASLGGETMVMVGLAGSLAESRFFGGALTAELSIEDQQLIRRGCELLGAYPPSSEFAALRHRADMLVAYCLDEIGFLAGKLQDAGRLDEAALGRLAWGPGSLLAKWKGLYQSPRLPDATTENQPSKSPPLPAWASQYESVKWSPAHNCWLTSEKAQRGHLRTVAPLYQ